MARFWLLNLVFRQLFYIYQKKGLENSASSVIARVAC